ncbi:MAG: carbohydrate ABC transporter substrate-binding protein, partial [Alphaproteobacteria bacterium]
MKLFKKGKLALLAGAMAMAVSGAFGNFASAADVTINMAVPDWPPTRIMQDLANKHYKPPSGNNVTIALDFIPWPNYYEKLAASLTS